MIDETGFRSVLRKAGKAPHVIDELVAQVARLAVWLEQRGPGLDGADEADLLAWAASLPAGTAHQAVRGPGLYFRHCGQSALAAVCGRLREQGVSAGRRVPRLSDFAGVPESAVAALGALGIATTAQLLEAAATPGKRSALARRSGVRAATVLELTKLADLARLKSVRRVRARLYYLAGLDTPARLASQEPAELRERLVRFVAESGFDGIAPLPKELANTVAEARKLPPAVQY